jgi:hypothetical protein
VRLKTFPQSLSLSKFNATVLATWKMAVAVLISGLRYAAYYATDIDNIEELDFENDDLAIGILF